MTVIFENDEPTPLGKDDVDGMRAFMVELIARVIVDDTVRACGNWQGGSTAVFTRTAALGDLKKIQAQSLSSRRAGGCKRPKPSRLRWQTAVGQ